MKISRNFLFESGTSSRKYLEETIGLPLEGESTGDAQQSDSISNTSRGDTPEPISQQIERTIKSELPTTPSKSKPQMSGSAPTTPLSTEYDENPNRLNQIPLHRLTRSVKDHNYRQLGNPDARLEKAHENQRAKIAIESEIEDESFQHYAFASLVGENQSEENSDIP